MTRSNTPKIAPSHRGNDQTYLNKHTQMCTLSLGMTALWPTVATYTGLCKFGWFRSSLELQIITKRIPWELRFVVLIWFCAPKSPDRRPFFFVFEVPEGRNLRGTTLREALQGSLPRVLRSEVSKRGWQAEGGWREEILLCDPKLSTEQKDFSKGSRGSQSEGHNPLRGSFEESCLTEGFLDGALQGFCGALQGSARSTAFSKGGDPMHVTLENCWIFQEITCAERDSAWMVNLEKL